MGMKLYIGNLTYGVTDKDLMELFAAHGQVVSAQVIMDRDTGRSKGFGFVEMAAEDEAQMAISAMNGIQVNGKEITVRGSKIKGIEVSSGRRLPKVGTEGSIVIGGSSSSIQDKYPPKGTLHLLFSFHELTSDKSKDFLNTVTAIIAQSGGRLDESSSSSGKAVDDGR